MKLFAVICLILAAAAVPSFGATEENVRFVITDVSPKVFEPGYRGTLNISVKNVGFGEGYRVNAQVTPNTSAPINFLGEIKKYIDYLNQPCTSDPVICNVMNVGDTAVFSYEISVEDDAATGGYVFPFSLFWRFGGLEKSSSLNFGIEVVGAPKLLVSGTSTAPSIVYPDTEFSNSVTVENIGSSPAKSVELSLTLPEGFSGETKAFLGTINKDGTSIATFNLKGEESLSIDKHIIQLGIKYLDTSGVEFMESVPLEIFIQDRGVVKLSISGINTTPSKIYPNTEFTMALSLENTGSQDARSTKVVLLLPKEFSGEDSAFLGTIQKSGLSSTEFDIKALKSSKPGTYSAKTRITYTDEQGRKETFEDSFNIFILDRGEIILEISGKSTSPAKLTPGTEFTLSIQLENIGDQDAKSVRIELEPNGDLEGEFTSFVGEIEQDDVSTGVFDLTVNSKAKPGTRVVTAKVVYLDERGVEGSVLKTFDLFVSEKGGRSRTTIAIVAVIVMALIIYLWRRRKSELTEA